MAHTMTDGNDELQIVERIYQAALDPLAWSKTLTDFLPTFRSKHACFIAHAGDNAPQLFHAGFSESELKIHFSPEAIRCWESWRPHVPAGQPFTNRHIMSDRDWECSEAYNEFVRYAGVYHGAMFHQNASEISCYFAICRPDANDAYSDEELSLLRALIPHFSRALLLQHRLSNSERQNRLLTAALDRVEAAAFAVNEKAMPVFANAHAQALLDRGDGLVVSAKGLRCAQPEYTSALLDAIAKASGANTAGISRLRLPCRGARLPLLLEIIPAACLGADLHGAGKATALLFVREFEAEPRIDYEMLGDTMRLTRREVEVIECLMKGFEAGKTAAVLGISLATVRFHIKNLLQKTSTRNQAALLSFVHRFQQ